MSKIEDAKETPALVIKRALKKAQPKPTYTQLEEEVIRLREMNDNLWRCCRASSVALSNAGLDPYPGRGPEPKPEPEDEKEDKS